MASVRKREWTHAGTKRETWAVEYTDRGGVRRRKQGFRTKKDADAYRLRVENEVESGDHVAPRQSALLSAAIEDYLRGLQTRHDEQRGVGEKHLYGLRLDMRRIATQFGHTRVSELGFADLERWVEAMRGAGHKPRTVQARVGHLKLLLEFCVRRRYMAKNVAARYLKELGGAPRARIRAFSEADVEALLAAAEQRPVGRHKHAYAQLRTFIHIAAFCGLRLGEISGLTVESIDFGERIIKVRTSLTRFDTLKGPKTKAGVRDVPMPAHVAALIRDWMSTFPVMNERRLIFMGRGKTPFSRTGFNRNWQHLLERAGLLPDAKLGSYHFHALRHFAASSMIRVGIPVTDVSVLMGHESFDMTLQVYAHGLMRKAVQADAIQGMASRLVGSALIGAPA